MKNDRNFKQPFRGRIEAYNYERIADMRSKYVLLLIVLVIQMVAAVGSAAGLSPMDAPLHGHEIEVTSLHAVCTPFQERYVNTTE